MRYAIYSCEGFAREVVPSLRRAAGTDTDIVFVDDDPQKIGAIVHGCQVIGFDQLLSETHRDRAVCVAISDPDIRKRVADRCTEHARQFFSIADPTHLQFENATVGEGAILCANTMITGDAEIGIHFHANIYSYVAHDCQIGDYVTFAPRVSCNGRVHIGDRVYVGTGALLKQGAHDRPLSIGHGAVIGMGAVVLDDVAAGDVVVGNPARVIRNRNAGQ